MPLDPTDLMSLLDPQDMTGPQKAKAMAAALRRQNAVGLVGAISGNPDLQGPGGALMKGAEDDQKMVASAGEHRLTKALAQAVEQRKVAHEQS
jgi:hypothetical protein